jgi:hypothetical protein
MFGGYLLKRNSNAKSPTPMQVHHLALSLNFLFTHLFSLSFQLNLFSLSFINPLPHFIFDLLF